MPHPDLNLPALRKIAEAPGHGEWKFSLTFDPPTVLALIARAEAAEASLAQAVEMARREEREACSKEADDVAEISLSVVRDASFTSAERQKAQAGVRAARTIARLIRARAAQERTA